MKPRLQLDQEIVFGPVTVTASGSTGCAVFVSRSVVDSDWRSDIVEDLQEDDVLLTPFGPSTIRATTHRDVSMNETEEALSII